MKQEPLASKIRPDTLENFIGQEHLVGENKPIRKAIEEGHLFSMIFWGPPGVGKTTLARIYAKSLNADFIELSAVSARKSDISFEVISPLLSRCKVFVLNPLSKEEMNSIINSALKATVNDEKLEEKAINWLINMADGDARQAISMIENSYSLYKKVTLKSLKETLQSKFLRYDKKGDEHYNTISAYIKSMRAGDANAALYYLARMVEVGEDPLFIARRMVIFASEDVGLASSGALLLANEVFRSCETIGYPECAINLAHGTAYLAKCKKNRSAYDALRKAQADVKKHGNLKIPLHLRNAPTKLMKDMNYGKGYDKYPDEDKNLLPDELKGPEFI
mgnify:CR=1 FL=1